MKSKQSCSRCKKQHDNPGYRFCRKCCKELLAEMKESGYLTPLPAPSPRQEERPGDEERDSEDFWDGIMRQIEGG